MSKITISIIGAIISLLSLIGGAYAWDVSQRTEQHAEINVASVAGDVELQLQTVNLEIKFLQEKRERDGQLSPDDRDRLDYLKKLREILTQKQTLMIS